MTMSKQDKTVLRAMAERYSELAHLDVQQERLSRYRQINGLQCVRPVVLIDEVPWGEIRDEALQNVCDPDLRWLEWALRQALYQWDHFQLDMVIPPLFRVAKGVHSSGIGLEPDDHALKGGTGTHIAAHEYTDLLQTEADLEKLQLPEIRYDAAGTEMRLGVAREVFDGLMEVELGGHALFYSIWDVIARYRGVDALLIDLAMRPEFMHHTVQHFADIAEATFTQYEEQGLLDPDQLLLHCTVGTSDELPAPDHEGTVRRKDVWGRCAAQIFGSVSPDMHDEFDLAYNEKLFGECGLVYYGCCEPMDGKVDILRKRFKNLRKISITPWADPERAARNMGSDYVLAAKPNPAFVSQLQFKPEVVEEEISRYCRACIENNTPLEFVIKDISTIANRPENLTQWASVVEGVVDRYYG